MHIPKRFTEQSSVNDGFTLNRKGQNVDHLNKLEALGAIVTYPMYDSFRISAIPGLQVFEGGSPRTGNLHYLFLVNGKEIK